MSAEPVTSASERRRVKVTWAALHFRNWRISNKLLVVMLGLSLVPLLLAVLLGTRNQQPCPD